jgi:hypothetical protein
MTDTRVPEPRTAAALNARRRTTQAALKRVHDALTQLKREKAQPSVAAVARRAGVSRTFVYDNSEARAAVSAALAQAGEQRVQLLTDQDAEREATWRERALNAEDALKAATPRSRLSAPASPNSSARSGIWKPNGLKRPSSGSPPRTPPSSNVSVSSPPTTAPSTNAFKRPDPTSGSRIGASPTSKPNSPTRHHADRHRPDHHPAHPIPPTDPARQRRTPLSKSPDRAPYRW